MAAITVDTPSSVVQCGPVSLEWSPGTPSYSVSVLNAQDPSNEPVITLLGNSFDPNLNAQSLPVLGNTLIVFQVTDQSGDSGKSTLVSVAPSNDFSCLPPDEQPTSDTKSPAQTKTPPASSDTSSPVSGSQSQPPQGGSSSPPPQSTGGNTVGSGKSTATGTRSQSVTGTLTNTNSASSGLPGGIDSTDGAGTVGESVGIPNSTGSVTSPSASGNLASPQSSSGLSPGVLAAIAGGAVVIVIIVAAIWIWSRRRRSQEAMDDWFDVPQHTTHSYNPGETPMQSVGGRSAYSMTEYGGAPAVVAPAAPHEYYNDGAMPGPQGTYRDELVRSPTEEYGEQHLAPHEYYDADPKQRRVLRASTSFAEETATRQVTASSAVRQATGSSAPRSRSTTGMTEVPTNLTPEEMARLADLVASRMRTVPQADEAPPMYE